MGILAKMLVKLKRLESPLVRDFTKKAEDKMAEIANDKYDGNDLLDKYIFDPVGRWLDKEGYLPLLSGMIDYQSSVIDAYNYSAQNIRDICSAARTRDGQDGNYIAVSASEAENVCWLLEQLGECLDPNSSEFYPEQPISDRLITFRNHWFKKDGKNYQISVVEQDAKNKYNQLKKHRLEELDIVEFCADPIVDELFREYMAYLRDEIDWSVLDVVMLAGGTVIYKGVEITFDEFVKIITGEDYTEKLTREQLNSLIRQVIEAEDMGETFMKDHKTAKEGLEKLIEEYMMNEDSNQSFKSFVKAVGGITVVKEMAESAPQLLDYLLTDYTKGLKILEDLERTCDASGDALLKDAIDTLQKDYNDKWEGVLREVKDFAVNTTEGITEEVIKKWIKDECGDSSVILSVLDIAGAGEKVDGYHKILTLQRINNSLQTAYEDAIAVIQSGNYTQEDLDYAENMFNMLKQNTIETYKTYRDICAEDPDKQIYLNEQITKLEKMEMTNYSRYRHEAP